MNKYEIKSYHDKLGACLAMADALAEDLDCMDKSDPESWLDLDRASRLYEMLLTAITGWNEQIVYDLGMEDEL